jgi:hypothetical protein
MLHRFALSGYRDSCRIGFWFAALVGAVQLCMILTSLACRVSLTRRSKAAGPCGAHQRAHLRKRNCFNDVLTNSVTTARPRCRGPYRGRKARGLVFPLMIPEYAVTPKQIANIPAATNIAGHILVPPLLRMEVHSLNEAAMRNTCVVFPPRTNPAAEVRIKGRHPSASTGSAPAERARKAVASEAVRLN